ncbi:hypothetical protein [Saccharopolyspora sp. NPDC002686]|uniref:hypothetical protein n=1 Tax=Saccharopolyspora sp. NPDC002686 TaxID=3154541 RepID=UPI00332D57F8
MTARKPSTLAGVRRVPIATVVEADHIVLFPAGRTKVHSITSIARPANGRVRIEFGVGEHAQHFDAPGALLISITRPRGLSTALWKTGECPGVTS